MHRFIPVRAGCAPSPGLAAVAPAAFASPGVARRIARDA